MKAILSIFLVCLAVLTGRIAYGQTIITGTPPFGTFTQGSIDTVDVGNLNVHVTIPILHKAGRGIPLNLSITYENSIWYAYDGSSWSLVSTNTNPSGAPFSGIDGYFEPLGNLKGSGSIIQTCYTFEYPIFVPTGWEIQTFYTYYDSSGTPHSFPGSVTSYSGTCGNSFSGSPGTATDSSGYTMAVNASGSLTVTDKTGKQINWTIVNGIYGPPTETDTNGNQISLNSNGQVVDTLGQTAVTLSGSGTPSSPSVFTYASPTGPATYTVKYASYTVKTNFGCTYVADFGPTPFYLISEIDLPDQPTNPSDKYVFTYEPTPGPGNSGDTTGRLASITLPTGGTLSYAYSGGNDGIICPNTGGTAILTRTTPDGSSTYTESWPYPSETSTTTVSDPLGDQTVINFSSLSGMFNPIYETQRSTSQNGALLQTVYTCYNGAAPPCNSGNGSASVILQKSVFTLWPSGQESEVNMLYDKEGPGPDYTSNGLLTEEDDYNYGTGGPGPLLRKTVNNYATLSNNILDRPSQVSVYNGSGGLAAQTNSTYDGSSLVPSGITTQHVPVSGSRGNLTTVSKLVSGSTYISQTYTYFDTGMVQVATDPKGNQTTSAYSSTYVGAYPTTVTTPLIPPTTYAYDISSGLANSVTDPNGQPTNYAHDEMFRIYQITYADGGTTTFSYPNPNEVNKSAAIASGISKTETSTLDGLGRLSELQLTSDPDGSTYEQTIVYDALGRKYEVYNPTRCSSPMTNCGEPTWGYTTYEYDALNRTVSVTDQDGSVTRTDYSAFPCITITDEAGTQRESCYDGLGRTTEVMEDPNGLRYATNYTYDGNDNLTNVVENGSRPRTFVYDSLSRLTSSTNPESNWSNASQVYVPTTYSYDANSNLVNKTEPAPNQQGTATVTLTYCYDALNRMTAKGYSLQTCSNGMMPTPAATYSYDQSGCLSEPTCYNIGRRTGMTDQAGLEAWAYDSMGRAIVDSRTTNGFTDGIYYGYNFDGSLASLGIGEQHNGGIPFAWLTETYQPGGAARPLSFSYNGYTLVNSLHYTPSGAECYEQDYWGSEFIRSNSFNNRLQPATIGAVGSTASPAPAQCAAMPSYYPSNLTQPLNLTYNYFTGHNNGNVQSIANTLWDASTRSQQFTYDSLNRLASASTTSTYSTDPADCWGENYGYDAWGNLLSISPMTGSYQGCTQESGSSVSVTNQNQISGYGYDTAGNLISVPSEGTYSYDAENHLISAAGVTYSYDGDGKRVMKSNGTIYWYGLNSFPLTLTDLSNNTEYTYYFLNGQRIARILPNNDLDWYFSDALGNVRYLWDSTGAAQQSDYYPFGGERILQSSISDPRYKFTGKERDAESGNDYFGARFYSSFMGRWLSPDWSDDPDPVPYADFDDPQSLNLYSYVRNGPSTSSDSEGHTNCVNGIDPVNGALCVVSKATPPLGLSDFGQFVLRVAEFTSAAPILIRPAASYAFDWLSQPRNTGCIAAMTSAGAMGGAEVGLAGGLTAELTVPTFGIGGAAVGWGAGMVSCMAGAGGAGGGGGGGSGSNARLTKPQQRQTAKQLGMKEVKGRTSQGQPVFEKDGRYFSFSNTSHTAGEVFKELDRNGNRIATTDLDFNRIGP
jgi:RHS repeat-associated protein